MEGTDHLLESIVQDEGNSSIPDGESDLGPNVNPDLGLAVGSILFPNHEITPESIQDINANHPLQVIGDL